MKTRHIACWIGLSTLVISLGVGSSTQPAADNDAPELTARQQNLLIQLADEEANIQAINKALKATGYSVGIAYGRIDSGVSGNEIMDRKGGGPVRWDEFYGKTAKAYAGIDPWGLRPGDRRPQQFNFVYKANNDQIAHAKDQIASLLKNQQALLDRRQKHEENQSRLWATLAWEEVEDREIDFRPLYRFALKPDGPDANVLSQLILFLRTGQRVAHDGLDSIQSDPKTTFQSGAQRMSQAYATLQQALADSLGADDLKPDHAKKGAELKALCKQVAEGCQVVADDYANALDRDKAKEDNSKLVFRGQLQSALSSFANEIGNLDDEISQTAASWGVTADKAKVTKPPTTMVTAAGTAKPEIPPATTGAGAGAVFKSGLIGEYFGTAAFKRPINTRIDSSIDFKWARREPPIAGCPTPKYSVRWTGRIEVPAGVTAIGADADDGCRLSIDGSTVAALRKPGSVMSNAPMVAGEHVIVIEYWNERAEGRIGLEWTTSNGEKQPVPAAALSHDVAAEPRQ